MSLHRVGSSMKQTIATSSIMGHPQVFAEPTPPHRGSIPLGACPRCFFSYGRKRKFETTFAQDSMMGTCCLVFDHLDDLSIALNESMIRSSAIAIMRGEIATLASIPLDRGGVSTLRVRRK